MFDGSTMRGIREAVGAYATSFDPGEFSVVDAQKMGCTTARLATDQFTDRSPLRRPRQPNGVQATAASGAGCLLCLRSLWPYRGESRASHIRVVACRPLLCGITAEDGRPWPGRPVRPADSCTRR
ncbi:MAG TPA: hypothetical protein VK988_15330 [Acidimicrobiales bacterium]|nr:hypothetical protein [Acidimicrobiales bacterium]